jgi:hypothetical protein
MNESRVQEALNLKVVRISHVLSGKVQVPNSIKVPIDVA